MFYKENKNFLNKEELDMVNNVILTNNFPWYFNPAATTDKFPFFSHTIVDRYDPNKEELKINSNMFEFFNNILTRFCVDNKIKVKKITRMSLNLTYPNCKYKSGDPHVDHDFNHKSIMIYLNKTNGDTIIYDKKFNGENILDINKNLKIKKLIKPEVGKVVCWDGDYYHAATYPKLNNRRVVLVSTFI
jgi:hypothetical protein